MRGGLPENDIKAKADDELLSMWAEQIGYLPEVVRWVRAEIEKRQLDTSAIHITTEDEIGEKEERESDSNFVRMVSFIQGVGGVFLLVLAIPEITEQLNAYYRYRAELDITTPLVMLLFGLLLIIYAIGVWIENKWAIITGLIFYLILSTLNIVSTITYGLALLIGRVTSARYLAYAVALTCINVGLVFAFNRIRKSQLSRK